MTDEALMEIVRSQRDLHTQMLRLNDNLEALVALFRDAGKENTPDPIAEAVEGMHAEARRRRR